jgi:hypothetical protein
MEFSKLGKPVLNFLIASFVGGCVYAAAGSVLWSVTIAMGVWLFASVEEHLGEYWLW